jgi:coenzyme F420 biosynthesis associated uncharacterized protein
VNGVTSQVHPSSPGRRAGHEPSERAGGVDVDWVTAARWAGRMAAPGPVASRAELEHVVEELRGAAVRARGLAVRAARLGGALEAAGAQDHAASVLVVDRPGWARAAGASFASLTGPDDGSSTAPATSPATLQAAGLLGLLSTRVLGQYDPFSDRLLLVAPNVLHTERALSAEPTDFRLWVCVHEQTHALQFAAAPWMADHLRREVGALVDELAHTSPTDELVGILTNVVRRARHGGLPDDWSVLDLALGEEQQARVERIGAVMSLLEGHADVSMDAVGARTIPSVRRLRARMESRRNRRGNAVERLLRRVVGMDAKLAQYRRGAQFVRGVRRAGGRDALDAVWTTAEALPTPRELADPRAWVRRVHG